MKKGKMNVLLFNACLLIFLLQSLLCPAQYADRDLTTRSKKAKREFEQAIHYISAKNYPQAVSKLVSALDADDHFIEAHLMLGDVYAEEKMYPKAIDAYLKAISIDSAFFPNAFHLVGNLELSLGKYESAKVHLRSYLRFPGIIPEKRSQCESKLRTCNFALDAIAHPVPFNPLNLGDSINTADDEYINAITADDREIYFTRKLYKAQEYTGRLRPEEDFYRSVKWKDAWSRAQPLGPPVNTGGDEGALCISPDGMELFYAAGYREDGFGRFDLYHAHRLNGGWSFPKNLKEPVNTETWESQPSISSDGKTLFFSSLRKGGVGSSDIWKSVMQDDGQWSLPVNLGKKINTAQSEMNPFIHPDGKTLYFSSSGLLGMGGYDLFYSRLDDKGEWSEPVNLGYPINSHADELSLIVNARGELAYFSSDKLGGYGKEDIYSFELYPEARPALVNYMKGRVFDSETKHSLEAYFELIDLLSGQSVVNSVSEPRNGEFLVTLPTGRDYALHVSKDDYLFYSENFSLTGSHSSDKPFLKDIPLQPIKTGEIVVLNNIFFETDKSELLPLSRVELDRLLILLNQNPKMRIEIRGHTDNVGSEEYNLKLSENRAKVVYDYLLLKGINSSRITFHGYGESMPVADNSTDEGKKLNRRTEFKVVEK
ncbi:MAG: OmpA family protein [Bacteroidales bacterium]